jgi:hypothetical protein
MRLVRWMRWMQWMIAKRDAVQRDFEGEDCERAVTRGALAEGKSDKSSRFLG